MNYENQTGDALVGRDFEKPTLPSGLNVLTILSIIWSVFQIIMGVYGYFSAEKNYREKDQLLEKMSSPDAPSFVKSMIGDPAQFNEMVTKSYENRLPILILSVVAGALCLYGCIQMRKLKKQGYLFYVIGEVLPFITAVLFIGAFVMSGIMMIGTAALAALFILLYTLNRKHLVY